MVLFLEIKVLVYAYDKAWTVILKYSQTLIQCFPHFEHMRVCK
jgi:hypothetical protein